MSSAPFSLTRLVGLLLLCAGAAVAQPVPDTLAQRLVACTACHGPEGRASATGYQPRLAGKPAGYLYNQLMNFRMGRRNNAAMTQLTDPLSEAYLRDMALHFAQLDLPYPTPPRPDAAPAVLERGRVLAQQGDARLGLPACSACHGATLTGVQPALPGLLGLPKDYISGQIGAWQTGLRRAEAPDCMHTIAQRLQGPDIVAVAAWLATQQPPAGAHPAPSLPAPLPMSCGSGLR